MNNFLSKELTENKIGYLTLHIKGHHPEYYQKIIKQTNYLPKTCKFTERIYHIINNLTNQKKCKYCQINPVSFVSLFQGYKKYCSFHCEQKDRPKEIIIGWAKKVKEKLNSKSNEDWIKIILKRKQSLLEKYGDENYVNLEKMKQSKLEKYGDENYCNKQQISMSNKKNWNENKKERIKLTKQTKLEKYGDENYVNLEKMKQSKLEKYGDENYVNLEKMKQSKLEKYYKKLFNSNRLKNLIIPLFSLEEYKGTKTEKYKFQCVKCNTIFESYLDDGHIPRCFKCYPRSNFTKPHKTICEYLEQQNIDFEIEKYISPYFVDIFIEPDKIIEVYGDYWHGNPKFYKEEKTLNLPTGEILVQEKWEEDEKRIKYLEKKGNKVLILWEDEIHNNFSLIEEKINQFKKEN